MLTGELKNPINRIWDSCWTGGISNPFEMIVQAIRDTSFGSREYVARDLEGNLWSFGSYAPRRSAARSVCGDP